jgi:hypothetical protein
MYDGLMWFVRPKVARVGLSLSVLTLASTTACSGADGGVYPEGSDSIQISGRFIGEPLTISLGRTIREGKPCSLESGDFGPWVDCSDSRTMKASFVSVECLPSTACDSALIDGSRATVLPLTRELTLRVVADFEGQRAEREQRLSLMLPSAQVRFEPQGPPLSGHPSILFEGGDVRFCVNSSTKAAVRYEARLDGELLPIVETSERATCHRVEVARAGTLEVTPMLERPSISLIPSATAIHPLRDVVALTVQDAYCPGLTAWRAANAIDSWAFGVHAYAITSDGSAGLLSGSAVELIDAGVGVRRSTRAAQRTSYFLFDGRPAATLRAHVTAGSVTEAYPVRVAERCREP